MHKCRFCGASLDYVILDLGFQPPSNAFLTQEQLDDPEVYYPLRLYVCEECWLVQIPEYKKAEDIFTPDYVYYSSQSPANVSHAKEFVDHMLNSRFDIKSVLEIVSNDGYLLQHFPLDVRTLGIEPAKGPAEYAIRSGITTHVTFFNTETAKNLPAHDLICSINVFAHQPDTKNFVEALGMVLNDDGVIVQEFPHVRGIIEGGQFDTIYHEHYNYYSLTTVCRIFDFYDLAVTEVELIPEHGGSLRVYAMHKGKHPISINVSNLLAEEHEIGIDTIEYYSHLQEGVDRIKNSLMQELNNALFNGQKVFAYGGAAKGNTLLNYCGVKPSQVPLVVDRSPHKQRKFLPGSHIAVVDESYIKRYKPAYILILPWNLKDEIMDQLSYIREWNGHFIVPIPEVEVL